MPGATPVPYREVVFRRLKTSQLVLDICGAVAFFLLVAPMDLVLFAQWYVEVDAAVQAAGAVGLSAFFAVALAVRRLSPSLALAIAWAAALLQMALARPPGAADIAIFGVLYATAAYGSRRVFWTGFASTFAGSVLITLYLFLVPAATGAGVAWSIPLAVLILTAATFALLLSWTVGALVRTAIRATENRRAQQQAEEEAVAEQERVRIARDMHDVVAHSLAVVIAQADGGRYAAASDPAAATAALATISTTARGALADVRLLLTQLRHSESAGPQPTLADLEGLYAQVRGAGVALSVEVDPMLPGEPPTTVQLAVYRILQEALTNAMRHGDGGPVRVRLSWWPDRVDLEVRNGTQARPDASPPGGHGLIGLRERAQLAGGHLDAGRHGDEFVVSATLPIGGVA